MRRPGPSSSNPPALRWMAAAPVLERLVHDSSQCGVGREKKRFRIHSCDLGRVEAACSRRTRWSDRCTVPGAPGARGCVCAPPGPPRSRRAPAYCRAGCRYGQNTPPHGCSQGIALGHDGPRMRPVTEHGSNALRKSRRYVRVSFIRSRDWHSDATPSEGGLTWSNG